MAIRVRVRYIHLRVWRAVGLLITPYSAEGGIAEGRVAEGWAELGGAAAGTAPGGGRVRVRIAPSDCA